ncbi:hypothetical protein NPIL_577901 [Nephila pilipes]|uniref:Uncharacterized protein n=1 Tax=Nephila pilipes TaxID=299642 RepID=A0A8X6P658_NEPPI|nr:hypothetical protein NPIL_577901 [Nephila pilipes]
MVPWYDPCFDSYGSYVERYLKKCFKSCKNMKNLNELETLRKVHDSDDEEDIVLDESETCEKKAHFQKEKMIWSQNECSRQFRR